MFSSSARHHSSRREFLATLAGVVALGSETLAMQTPGPKGIPLRPLGKTGARIPIVGYGGWDCVVDKTESEAIRMMHEAIDLGVTFWDNAWEYHDGGAETMMGKALESSKRRDEVFLMTKCCARDYDGFQKQFHESLRRLRTDHVDLLQFHAIQYPGDEKRVVEGGLKAALEAKKAGKLRFVGFSGHMDPNSHLAMLAAHEWDSVQMPLNLLDAQHPLSFQKMVVPVCRKRNIGVLGMKSLAGQDARLPRDLKLDWELCRRYAMSLPVSTTICGMQKREELLGMVKIARGFKPLGEQDIAGLLAKTKDAALEGAIEEYKNRAGGYGCSYHAKVLQG